MGTICGGSGGSTEEGLNRRLIYDCEDFLPLGSKNITGALTLMFRRLSLSALLDIGQRFFASETLCGRCSRH